MHRWTLAAGAALALIVSAAGCKQAPVPPTVAEIRLPGTTPPPTGGASVSCDPAKLERIAGMACGSEGAACGVCPKDAPGQCRILVCQAGTWQPNVVPVVPPGPPGAPRSR